MTGSTQSCPGTIQLANALSSGMGIESVAYAKMGQAMNDYSNSMELYAHDQYTQGQEMIKVSEALTVMQWVTAVTAVLTVGIGAGVAFAASGATTGVAAGVSSAVNGIGQAMQGVVGAVQGGMQAYKSGLQGETEMDSTAIAAFGKTSDNDSKTIKDESQGVSKLGSAINEMLMNEGAIERQKITH